MVIMPLVSGGVLTKLARKFGVNLPDMGGAQGARGGGGHSGGGHQGGYYGSEGYGKEGGGGAGGIGGSGMNLQNVASSIGGLASLAKMAQTFM